MKILMLGPDLTVRGGVSSVEKVIMQNKSFIGRFHLYFLATHKDGSKAGKLWVLILSLLKFMTLVGRYDKVYIHMSFGASFYRKSIFIFLSSLLQKKIILHMHGSQFDQFYHGGSAKVRKVVRFICNRASRVIVLTQKWAEFYQTFIDPAKIQIIPNSVKTPGVNLYNPDSTYISLLGYIGKRKGVYDILEIIPDIVGEFPQMRFMFAGNGEVEAARAKALELGVADFIEFPGWVDETERERILRNSLIFLLPSYHEGLPMAVLEAMSYGIPVITSDVGGMPEIIGDGDEGFLIRPGDREGLKAKMIQLIREPDLRKKLSENAYAKIVKGYGGDKFAKQLSQALLGTNDIFTFRKEGNFL